MSTLITTFEADASVIACDTEHLARVWDNYKYLYPDVLLLVRMGNDVYESCGQDANVIAHEMGYTVVRRFGVDHARLCDKEAERCVRHLARAGYRCKVIHRAGEKPQFFDPMVPAEELPPWGGTIETLAALRAPWRRERVGDLEYILDADGNTICTLLACDDRHDLIVNLLLELPEMAERDLEVGE